MPHDYQGMVLSLKPRPELTGSCFPTVPTESPVMELIVLIFAFIVHTLVWLECANNGRMRCGIVVIDINRCEGRRIGPQAGSKQIQIPGNFRNQRFIPTCGGLPKFQKTNSRCFLSTVLFYVLHVLS